MAHLARTCFASFCLITLSLLAQAQTPTATPSTKDAPMAKAASTKKTAATRGAADPLTRPRAITIRS
jgi:outer membrane receptor for monomeric catechols